MSFAVHETLNTGAKIPVVGYGTWQAAPGEVAQGIENAMKAGYRHLDAAKCYQNQREFAEGFARGLAATGTKREDYFITSKLWNTHHSPELVPQALDDTLQELNLTYLDLYLIHWPVEFKTPTANVMGDLFPKKADNKLDLDFKTSLVETWKAMVALPKDKVKAVGVSNFTPAFIDAITAATGVTPAANQVERHPRLLQLDLLKYCKEKGIHVTAYSGFGNNLINVPLLVTNDVIKQIADAKGATPAQVLIAWGIYGGNLSIIPKSVTPKRIEENFKQIELTEDEVKRINEIGEKEPRRFNLPATYGSQWEINIWDTPEEASFTKVKVQ